MAQGVAQAEGAHEGEPLEFYEQVLAVAAHNGVENCAVRAARRNAEVQNQNELAKYKETEQEASVETA